MCLRLPVCLQRGRTERERWRLFKISSSSERQKMRSEWLPRLVNVIRVAALPFVTVAAFAAIIVGVWWISPAVALITGGTLILADVVFMHRQPRGRTDDS